MPSAALSAATRSSIGGRRDRLLDARLLDDERAAVRRRRDRPAHAQRRPCRPARPRTRARRAARDSWPGSAARSGTPPRARCRAGGRDRRRPRAGCRCDSEPPQRCASATTSRCEPSRVTSLRPIEVARELDRSDDEAEIGARRESRAAPLRPRRGSACRTRAAELRRTPVAKRGDEAATRTARRAWIAITCFPSCRRSANWAATGSGPRRARARAPASESSSSARRSSAFTVGVGADQRVRRGERLLGPLERVLERRCDALGLLQRHAQRLERRVKSAPICSTGSLPSRSTSCVRLAVISSSGVGIVGNSGIGAAPDDLRGLRVLEDVERDDQLAGQQVPALELRAQTRRDEAVDGGLCAPPRRTSIAETRSGSIAICTGIRN